MWANTNFKYFCQKHIFLTFFKWISPEIMTAILLNISPASFFRIHWGTFAWISLLTHTCPRLYLCVLAISMSNGERKVVSCCFCLLSLQSTHRRRIVLELPSLTHTPLFLTASFLSGAWEHSGASQSLLYRDDPSAPTPNTLEIRRPLVY